CAEKRVSLRFPAGLGAPAVVVVNGMLPKFVAMPLPVLVERLTTIASRKPPMSRSASPTWIARGDDGGGDGGCDPPPPPCAAAGATPTMALASRRHPMRRTN